MAGNPFDQFDTHQGAIVGPPRLPTPQTPDQATGQTLQNTHTQQQIQAQPLQNANTQVNIQQGQASIQNQHFNQNQGLRQEFNNLPEVKNYSVALQSLGTALKAPDTPQGDLSVIYAYAKAADPGSVVREGEMDMATATASLPQKYQADLARLTQGKRLPPEVRRGLIETMRQSVSGLRQVYDQQRGRYSTVAQQNGMDPAQIVGQPLYDAIRPLEENYIRSQGGTPIDPNAAQAIPVHSSQQSEAGFGLQQDPRETKLSSEQANAYDAWWKANPNPTPRQLLQFGSTIGLDIPPKNAQAIIDAAKQGRGISHDLQVRPDISDVRNGRGFGEKADAFARGAADTLTSGLADKVAALGDTVTRGGTFDQNMTREYAISDYDQNKHFPSRVTGQVAGGALLPFGEAGSVGQVAAKSAAYGAAYGLGSSRSLSDVPKNVLTGAIAGAVVGPAAHEFLGAGAAGRALAGRNAATRPVVAGVPPLVDPQTGALNQPLEAMTPGQRVVHAEEYGINLPADAAGGRSAAIIGKGLDINPGSAGVMEDARRATESQVTAASDVAASRYGSSRTMNEAGAELQRGANERIARGKDVISKAYNAIPIHEQAPASTSNAVATLQQLTGRLQSNPELADAVKDPKLVTYLNALQNGKLSWGDLKQFRSLVGEKIGDMRFGEGHSTSDLRALYAGLSEDMKATAAAMGPRASSAFQRANNLNRQNEQIIDNALTRILGKDGKLAPERAAAAVQAMTKGGKSTGDLQTLAQIRGATIKSGAWNEIAATLIRLGGQPANSTGRDFNPQTFVNWYADMSEPARAMLFGKSELRKSLDGFVAVNQRLMKVNALRNTSNTAGGLVAAGTAAAMTAPFTMAVMGHPGAGALTAGAEIGTALGGFAMAKAWTNPSFVRWVTGYTKAVAVGNQNAVRSQIGRIGTLAATNPDLREPLIALQQRLANDNFTQSVASQPNDGDQRKNQR